MSKQDVEMLIEAIEAGWSTEDILETFQISEGSLAAYRANVTRGTYDKPSH